MLVDKKELFAVLQEFNPWWDSGEMTTLPNWERTVSKELHEWTDRRDSSRSLLLSGPRQVGKTTLLLQAIRRLLANGAPKETILYATFDHPIIKLAGADTLIQVWRELNVLPTDQPIYLFLDEVQYIDHWATWLKHQADFNKSYKIAVTGSALPIQQKQESGVGRWETLKVPTLSFYEYLMLRDVTPPNLPELKSFVELFDWTEGDFLRVGKQAQALVPHFHEYLMRGGFPEPALIDDITRTQKLLREDIVDKVLKRDMTAIFGVRRVIELEKIFLYLCLHDGGTMDVTKIASELEGISRSGVTNFLELFEQTHLVYRLKPYGYGKEVLRGKSKYYLADPALSGSVLLLGKRLLLRPDKLGAAVEAAFFKHLFTRYYQRSIGFSYWQDRKGKGKEVDVIAEFGDHIIPFEVKYQDKKVTQGDVAGLRLFLEEKKLDRGYVITQRSDDFGPLEAHSAKPGKKSQLLEGRITKIPAPLACYWLSSS
jgi:uncharacterized protein